MATIKRTIEEKAKAYDERLAKARKEYSIHEANNAIGIMDALERVFPELKESEDEVMRKKLLELVAKHCGKTCEMYLWLEKQGKSNMGISEATKQKLEDNLNKALEKETPESWNKFLGEQKPADKVEPKFREGDVLCDCCEEYDNPLIFILKKFERVDFGLVKPSDYSSYCFLTAGERQIFKEGKYHHKHNIKPATKEQRDLLFKKMHEAGYEWDADKKELKKIEQKLAEWSEEDKKLINDTCHLINTLASGYGKKVTEPITLSGTQMIASIKDRLRSLVDNRPQNTWKPSEEQIDALEDAIADAVSSIQKNMLNSLYSDLKKL